MHEMHAKVDEKGQPMHEAVPQEPASGPSVHVLDFRWEIESDSESSQSRTSVSAAHAPRASSCRAVPNNEIERHLLESRLSRTGIRRKGQRKTKLCSALPMSRDLSDDTESDPSSSPSSCCSKSPVRSPVGTKRLVRVKLQSPVYQTDY